MIAHSNQRNLPLYALAVARNLPCDRLTSGHYLVGSSQADHDPYHVQTFEDGYLCSCLAAWKGKACSHGALAASVAFPEVLCGWLLERAQEIRVARHERECEAWRRAAEARRQRLLADIRRLDAECEALLWERVAA